MICRIAILLAFIGCDPAASEDRAEDLANLGDILLRSGSHEEALEAFDKALEIDPEMAEVWMSRGYALMIIFDRDNASISFKRAAEIYADVLRSSPEDGGAWTDMGEALVMMGYTTEKDSFKDAAYEEGQKDLQRAVDMNPDRSEAWTAWGFSILIVGPDGDDGLNESLTAFDRAIALDPDNAAAWSGRGHVFVEMAIDVENEVESQRLYEEAIRSFDESIRIDPEYISPWGEHGSWEARAGALLKLGRYDEAVEASDRALEIHHQSTGAILFKAKALSALGREIESIETYDRAIDADPDGKSAARIFMLKGIALIDMKRYEEALEAFDRAEQLDPDNWLIGIYKTQALEALGRDDEALESHQKLFGDSSWAPKDMNALIISDIYTVRNESIGVTNGLDCTANLDDWVLKINGSRPEENGSEILPNLSLSPGEAVRIHMGAGPSSRADIYLDSDITLNDTRGRISIADENGTERASLGYSMKPGETSIFMVNARGDFNYPDLKGNVTQMVDAIVEGIDARDRPSVTGQVRAH